MPKTNVDVSFSYDPHAENGPSNWGKLPIDDNQCDGTSNSPIAIQTYECDRYEDYILNVSTVFFFVVRLCYVCLFVCIFFLLHHDDPLASFVCVMNHVMMLYFISQTKLNI